MKLILILTLAFLTGCYTYTDTLNDEELIKWSIKNDTIFYDGSTVAIYDHCEFELNPEHGKRHKTVQELSIIQINFEVGTDKLISYIHTKHPKQKVEIIVPKR